MLLLTLLTTLMCLALLGLWLRPRPRPVLRRPIHPPDTGPAYIHRKPAWVGPALTQLAASMPGHGCRSIAAAFNRQHVRNGVSVGKTFVAEWIKTHRVAILLRRKQIKNRPRRQGPRGLVFALDLSFHDQRPVLGVLDHGTRALLTLVELRERTTIGVLRLLLDLFQKVGTPRCLRTDNESLFASRLMTLALAVLGVRHQRIDRFCPWQNGRIERLFGTLRPKLEAWFRRAGVPDDLDPDLDTFRAWYNHARSHQSLGGLTPAMAWAGTTEGHGRPQFFFAWDGLLTGLVTPT